MAIATLTCVLSALTGGAASGAPIVALDFTGGSAEFSGANWTVGWQFTTTNKLTVAALGFFDMGGDGLAHDHSVGLWTESGALLTQATVSIGGPSVSSEGGAGRWVFTEITPLTLPSGTYVVGAFYEVLDADRLMLHTAIPSTIPGLTFDTTRSGGFGSLSFPEGAVGSSDNPGYFGPNLAIRPVPEAGSVVLLCTGLVAVARRRRHGLFRTHGDAAGRVG
jgi:hypothetical protein